MLPPRARTPHAWAWLVAVLCLGIAAFAILWALLGGPDTKNVPSVVGFSQDAAQAKMTDSGFKEVDVVYRSSEQPDGTVLDQIPESGADLSKGSRVALTISTGKPEATVPVLVGLTSVGADRLLATVGLTGVPRVITSDKRAGTVLTQNPDAGARVAKGTRVFFDVAKGPNFVRVPALRGLTEQVASKRLANLGLVPDVRRVPSAEPVGRVLAQDPPRQAEVKPGTKVSMNVSRGLGLVTVPALRGLQRAKAVAKLRAAGLVPVVVVVSSSRPRGRVLAQDPPREQKVEGGTEVRINVASGPKGSGKAPPPPPPPPAQ
jgi:eukaryotic-like serine/threonine-protein kinase